MVLALGGAVLVARLLRRDSPSFVDQLHRAFVGVVDIQFLLGVALYLFLSPWPRLGWSDPGAAMGDDVLRFFTIEHAFGMVVAVGAAHAAWSNRAQYRKMILAQLVWMTVTLLSIPWPFLAYGRPLFRM